MKSCNEIADLLASEPRLGTMARWELRVHLFMCKHCASYARHLRALGEALRRQVRRKDDESPTKDLEDRILRRHLHDKE
jgi:hypothetical protein